jgi:ankyrin repeat protein
VRTKTITESLSNYIVTHYKISEIHKNKMDDEQTHSICNAIRMNDYKSFVQHIGDSEDEITHNAMIYITSTGPYIHLSPYLLCAKYGRYEMLQYLLNIPTINMNQHDASGTRSNALMIVLCHNVGSASNAINCAKLLLSNLLFNVNAVDGFHRTALMLAADNEKQYRLLKVLLKRNDTDVNVCDAFGSTALDCAVMVQIPLNLRLLLRHPKVLLNEINNVGNTPLLLFVSGTCSESDCLCARQLLDHPELHANYMNGRNMTASSVTLLRDKFIAHAMIMHGRV